MRYGGSRSSRPNEWPWETWRSKAFALKIMGTWLLQDVKAKRELKTTEPMEVQTCSFTPSPLDFVCNTSVLPDIPDIPIAKSLCRVFSHQCLFMIFCIKKYCACIQKCYWWWCQGSLDRLRINILHLFLHHSDCLVNQKLQFFQQYLLEGWYI